MTYYTEKDKALDLLRAAEAVEAFVTNADVLFDPIASDGIHAFRKDQRKVQKARNALDMLTITAARYREAREKGGTT